MKKVSELSYTLADGRYILIEALRQGGADVSIWPAGVDRVETEPELTTHANAELTLDRLHELGYVPNEITTELRTYSIGDGMGGNDDYEADSLEDALENAGDWASGGDWGEGKSYLDVSAIDWTGESQSTQILVGDDPEEPELPEGVDAHEWASPYSVVGGCRENPGVWGIGGTQLSIKQVSRQTGHYRVTITESTPGNYPETPEQITYEEPDETSLNWVWGNQDEWTQWIKDHDNDDDLDLDDLDKAFRAIFRRDPDDTDREQGLWSHLCASVK